MFFSFIDAYDKRVSFEKKYSFLSCQKTFCVAMKSFKRELKYVTPIVPIFHFNMCTVYEKWHFSNMHFSAN